jgi:tetratricopeptide (TPR) repeat protein
MAESSREEIAKLEALYASNPAGRVFTHLADAYRKAGELERARGILEEGLVQHPGYASAHVVFGRVLMDLQEGDAAIDAFQKVLELDPHNMVALQSLAELTRASGRHEEALRYYQELRQHDPNSAEVEAAIAELSGAARAAETEDVAASEPEYGEVSLPHGDAEPAWQPDSETTSAADEFAEAGAASDWEQPAEPELSQSPEPVFAETSDVTEDVDLDWLAAGPEERDLGDLSGISALEDETEERTFDFADEIGDISSLSMAGSEAEHAESIPFEDLTLQAPSLDMAAAQPAEVPSGELLTETIAELYRSQGLYDRAADVYRSLLRERPGDAGLEEKLREVEVLDRGGPSRPEPEGETPDLRAWESVSDEAEPAAHTPPQDNEPDIAVEHAEAWLAGGAGTADSAPTPYAWAEQASESPADGGPQIGAYFKSLLAWRPKAETAVSESPFDAIATETGYASSEAAEEPFLVLEEPEGDAQAMAAESAAVPVTPEPAAEGPEALPWERPVQESYGRPSIAPTPHDETAEAFDAWFGQAEDSAAPEPAASAQPAAEGPLDEGDDDDDLEMFRSWLQSLKK